MQKIRSINYLVTCDWSTCFIINVFITGLILINYQTLCI